MADVKRPILLQLGPPAQGELCKSSRSREPQQPPTRGGKSLQAMDRSSVCSSESSSSSSSSSSSTASGSSSSEISSPSLILPYLYVGDQAQTQIDTISSLNISYILSLQSLPKFLSGSPQSTPPPTPTTTAPSTPLQHQHHLQLGQSELPVPRPIGLQKSPSLNQMVPSGARTKSMLQASSNKQGASLEAKFDIIDGADGGLLPSANSSKDYVVQIKHLTSEKDRQQDDATYVRADQVHLMDVDDDDDGSFERGSLPQRDHRLDASDSEINCDNNSFNSEDTVLYEWGSVLNDCSSQTMLDEQSSQTDASTSGDLVQQDDRSVDETDGGAGGGCSLKQRCNRLSSSVHRLIKGKCINISDTFETLLDKFFDETHSFIEEARRNKCNVLVHCKAGISRSPTIAIAYLMKWKRLHLQDAYEFVKRCRPQISPNLNFMGQLVSYERQLQCDRSHLPSPTSSCLPSLSMSCRQQQQHPQKSAPSEVSQSTSTQGQLAQQARVKNGIPCEPRRGVPVVCRKMNQNSVVTNIYDSDNKRARLRCFFRRRN